MSGSALIIDDHPLYREALTQLLRALVGDRNVRAASSAEEGIRLAEQVRDLRIVLMDFGLPGMSGTEAIATLLQRRPDVELITVSASEERRDAGAALRAGARHFISKAVGTDVLADTIRRVLSGDYSAPEWITPSGAGVLDSADQAPLTPRQLEILSLLHLPNKEIGLRLGLAEVTVKMHVSAIFRVLEVANRTQAMQAARRLSLGRSEAVG